MGSYPSIFYENSSSKVKSQILEEFIKTFNDPSINEILIEQEREKQIYYIFFNKVKIYFKNRTNLFEFVSHLKRPYIVHNKRNTQIYVRFVYGKIDI
jgi:hypothetical protein